MVDARIEIAMTTEELPLLHVPRERKPDVGEARVVHVPLVREPDVAGIGREEMDAEVRTTAAKRPVSRRASAAARGSNERFVLSRSHIRSFRTVPPRGVLSRRDARVTPSPR
jgi:hypothetical protein